VLRDEKNDVGRTEDTEHQPVVRENLGV